MIEKTNKIHTFQWNGFDRKGAKVFGSDLALDLNELKSKLRKQGINITKAHKKHPPLFSFGNNINHKDITLISRQISTMLGAGIPLVQSLNMIAKSSEKISLRELIGSIAYEVSTGTALVDALKKHPKYFDTLYCNLVNVGEVSGKLDLIFDRITIYKEKSEAIKSTIMKAILYPAFVLIVALAVTTILLIFVIPQFQSIFDGFGTKLPALTLFVLDISDFVQKYFYCIFAFLAIASIVFKKAYSKYKIVRDKTDQLLFKIPIIKNILNKASIARFSRTISTCFSAGIPIVDALTFASKASGNYIYKTAIENISLNVVSGMQINSSMRLTNLFPSMVCQMVMIGEETGELDNMLTKVAIIHEQEVDDAVVTLTTLLEPIIIVVLGIIIGTLIIAMYLPIFSMGNAMG